MPLIARQRSHLAVLAVLALVGSLLAISAVPVAAEDGKADNKAVFSACVNAAAEDAGFTDMDGDSAEDAANCLAHYGITKGTSEGVFSPRASITRLQLALFLARAASPAGLELLDAVDDQGFTDIDSYTSEIQDAINNLADLEIMGEYDADDMMMGKAFNPQGLVTRASMATALDAFLGKAILGPGAIGGGANQDKYSGDNADVKPDDEQFTDIRRTTTDESEAIGRLFEVGVTTGTTDTTFGPGDYVSRGQMALFITRMLDHTNARPAGLSIQSDTASTDSASTIRVNVSLRNDAHEPMEDAIIDIFTTSAPADAFNDDGTCDTGTDGVDPEGGNSACSIDASDEITDPDGNLDIDVSADSDGSLKLWAWTGKIGDTYDDDKTDKVTLEVTYTKPATQVKVSDNMTKHADALRFGDSITFTFQVVDVDGNDVAMKDVEITVDSIESTGSPMTDTNDPPQTTNPTATTGVNAFRTLDKEYKTDADGQVEATFSIDDPRSKSADRNDIGVLDLDVTLSDTALSVLDKTGRQVVDTDDENDDADDNKIVWRDTEAVATNLVLGLAQEYHKASDEGDGARNTVTATLVDQYGDPISRAKVRFYSIDDSSGLRGTANGLADTSTNPDTPAGPKARSTNRNGVATQSYARNSETADTEEIFAQYVVGCNDLLPDGTGENECPIAEANDIVADADASTLDADDGIDHYWAEEAEAGNSGTIFVKDADNNTIVLNVDSSPKIATYKSTDQFSVAAGNETGTDVLAPGTRDMAGFVRALKAADEFDTVTVTLSGSRKTPSTFVLTTNSQ